MREHMPNYIIIPIFQCIYLDNSVFFMVKNPIVIFTQSLCEPLS